MSKPSKPLYQARNHYRKSRLHDSARLLPLFGIFALILPVFWGGTPDRARETSSSGLYLFGVWMLLILSAALLSRHLIGKQDEENNTESGRF